MIKNTNKSLVLTEILKNECVTKRILAERTALSFPTVSKIVDDMEAAGQLVMAGMADSVNGRKAAIYKLNSAYAYILSIYFQYDMFTCVIGDACKKIVSVTTFTVLKAGYLKTLETIINDRLEEYPIIKVVSIGVPGSVIDGKIRFINHYEELQGFDLAYHLKKKFKVQMAVERDMNVIMQAIRLKKEYEHDQNLSVVILTTDGPGCASLIDGRIVKGVSGIAGEIGFLPLYHQGNLQDIALKGFPDTDLYDYTAKIIACIAVMSNPYKLIILKTAYAPEDMNQLARHCEQYILKDMIPSIELSDEFHSLYQDGLLEVGQRLLFR